MASMAHHIDRYEEACAVSAQMVGAARAGDWDLLIDLEARIAAWRDAMMAEPEPAPGNGLDGSQAARKRRLIRQLLDDDAEIRRYTEPWKEHVRALLGDHVRRRRVQQAYAATDTPVSPFDGEAQP